MFQRKVAFGLFDGVFSFSLDAFLSFNLFYSGAEVRDIGQPAVTQGLLLRFAVCGLRLRFAVAVCGCGSQLRFAAHLFSVADADSDTDTETDRFIQK